MTPARAGRQRLHSNRAVGRALAATGVVALLLPSMAGLWAAGEPQAPSRAAQRPLAYGLAAQTPQVDPATARTAAAQDPVARFFTHAEGNAAFSPEARATVRALQAEAQAGDGHRADLLTQAVAVVSPAFHAGLEALETARYRDAARRMGALRSDADPFIAVHASVYEIRALVADGDPLAALARIEALTTDADRVARFSYFRPELQMIHAHSLMEDLRYKPAANVLQTLLDGSFDLPPRIRVPAERMLQRLRDREADPLVDAVALMDNSGRRLAYMAQSGARDFDEVLRPRQQRIIELLDALIAEAQQQEEGERDASAGASGETPGMDASSPMEHSVLPGGEATTGPLRSARRVNPADVWGSMPPAQREQVLQALRDTFPARYRKLVEQYYEQLAKQP